MKILLNSKNCRNINYNKLDDSIQDNPIQKDRERSRDISKSLEKRNSINQLNQNKSVY